VGRVTNIASLIAIALVMISSATSYAASAANPLMQYDGTWEVSRGNSGKPYRLTNKCQQAGSFFVCEQSVDGSVTGLMVISSAGQPGKYWTQTILPGGRATGKDDLEIEGTRWTFASRRQEAGKVTYFRTINVFAGKDRIHFERAESTDAKNWSTKDSGDQRRVAGASRK
jgi:hypothetical protein